MNRHPSDEPEKIRGGAEVDAVRLARYLAGRLDGVGGALVVEQFSKGFSNLTYLLRAGEREYVLRRPPVGVKIKSAHDMSREYRLLSKVWPVYKKVPRPIHYCEDESILGAPFYVMDRVRGVILRAKVRDGLELREERMRATSESLVKTLAEIHGIDFVAAGLGDFGKPEGYVERQVRGWIDRYATSKTDDIPAMDDVGAWLLANMPKDTAPALIHNDFKYDNVVLRPESLSEIVAVLDWEMTTIGDPLMDLGTTLGYWVQADDPPGLLATRFGPTHLPGNLTRMQIVERYGALTGRDVSNVLFYYVFALYKLGVVAQQLYRRVKDGLTAEPRYVQMLNHVQQVSSTARSVLDAGRFDTLRA
ncbi:MAG: phosphotransferase family protein [Polyangiaceae bacterium]